MTDKPHINVGTLGNSTQRSAAMLTGATRIEADTEASTELQEKALEGAEKVVALVGGGYAKEDGTRKSLSEIMRAAKEAGKTMILADSFAAEREARDKKEADKFLAVVSLTGAMGALGVPVWRRAKDRGKPLQKCGLPRCDVMHSHNGGYCCADHCREHRTGSRASGGNGRV